MLIDTHAHVNFNAFKDDADDVIRRSLASDTWMILVGSEVKTSKRALECANKYEKGVYAAVGLHPMRTHEQKVGGDDYDFTARCGEFSYDVYEKLAQFKKTVAVGEIGLDYHWAKTEEERFLQHECFISQLVLAEKLGLPVVVHSRDAEAHVLEILGNFNLRYMLHCFSGTAEQAQAAVAGGRAVVSIPPMRSKERKKFIRDLPLVKLLAESDAPYIGKSPSDTLEAIKTIAEIKEQDVEAVKKQLLLNTIAFFGIKG